MGSLIDTLIHLQKLDSKISQLKALAEGKISELVEKERQNALLQRRADDLAARIKEAQKDCHLKEIDVKEHDARIDRFREQLNSVKDNKAYKALLDEIALANKSKSELEEALLATYEREEKLSAELEEVKQLLAEGRREQEQLDQRNRRISAEASGELAGLQAERDKVASTVSADVLSKYEQVRRSRPNALIPVRNNTCQGCFMNVTAQIYNQLLLGEEITFCNSCGRILYLEPEDEQAGAGKK